MKCSIIVPIYNVEKYLSKCLDSLVAQTTKDIEVILVNDGSTDNSLNIANEYVEKYPNLFKVVTKQNGGLSDARNYGIPFAKGEYIGFLDSDDYVDPSTYEKLIHKMDEGNDVVVCNIQYFYEDGSNSWVMKGLSSWNTDNISKKALLSPMFAWNKLYKAKYFVEDGLRYPLDTWYEDIPITTQIFAKTDKIGYVDETLMFYRQRSGSIMSETNTKRLFEIFGIMEMVRDNFDKLGLSEEYKDEIEYLHIEHLRLYGMFRFIRSNMFKELYDQSEAIMNSFYPNWKQNKYIKNLSFKNRMFLKHYSLKTSGFFKLFIH